MRARAQSTVRVFDRDAGGSEIPTVDETHPRSECPPASPYIGGCHHTIHGSRQGVCRGPWMPTDQVRGLKAHGSSPAKTKLAGEFLPLVAARFSPDSPTLAERGRVQNADATIVTSAFFHAVSNCRCVVWALPSRPCIRSD